MQVKKKKYSDAERVAIMERIEERCSTNVSKQASASGRQNDFITVSAYPFQAGCPRAEFAWDTADRISQRGGIFEL